MRSATLDCALLLLFGLLLIWPLFHVEHLSNWMSIDGAFIGDARFLSEHLPSPEWTPGIYCGNRYSYLYPPAMRYATALLSRYGHLAPGHAYHAYSALLYTLFAVGAYLLVRAGTRSRWSALAAGTASLVVSPVLLMFPNVREDSALQMPQRLNVLVKWGEVPHTSSMSLLLLALAACWLALRERRPRMLALASVLAACCVSSNFYGATALAICFSLMVWTLWVTLRDSGIWWRALAIAGLSYALTAWWLTPSYLVLTAENLKLVARPATTTSRAVSIAGVLIFAGLSYWWGRRRPERAWPLFLAGGAFLFGLNSTGGYYAGLTLLGEPIRLLPEFDLMLILASVECARRRLLGLRFAGGLVLTAAMLNAVPYISHPWGVFVRDDHQEQRIEYRMSRWLVKNLPGARVYLSGSMGLWTQVWEYVPQVNGISDQGMQNRIISLANWQVLMDNKPQRDLYWLKALGAEAIVVHGMRSSEIYHPIRHWEKFKGVLPVLHDNGEDDIVYQVPRRSRGLVHVVDRRRMEGLPQIPWIHENEPQLRAYVEALESIEQSSVSSQWLDPRTLDIKTKVREGEALAIQVTHDNSWRATSGGTELLIHKDVMGFMRVDTPPGDHQIRLEFRTPLENRVGQAVSSVALILVALLLANFRKQV